MKKRNMVSGDVPHFMSAIDEIAMEVAVSEAYPSRAMAMYDVNSEGWITYNMEIVDNDTIIMESRSDRGHLAIVVVSTDADKAEKIAVKTFKEFDEV